MKRHKSVPEEIPNRVFEEFQLSGINANPEFAVKADEPWITLESLRFVPGRTWDMAIEVDEVGKNLEGVDQDGVIVLEVETVVAVLSDSFGSRIRPATVRWNPNGNRRCAVRWYYADHRGRRVRNGLALPIDTETLPAGEYVEPPPPDRPMADTLTFYPEATVRGRGRRRRAGVRGMSIAGDGRPVIIPDVFKIPAELWGQPMKVMLIEQRCVIEAIPLFALEEQPEAVAGAMAMRETVPVDLGPDEFVHNSKRYNVFEVLGAFGITLNSTYKEVDGARKRMEHDFHPDQDKQLKAYKSKGREVPEDVLEQRGAQQALYRAAFTARMIALKEREAEAK
jgi:hypothetical protein